MDIIGGTDPRCLHHIDYPGVCSTVISGGKNSAITLGLYISSWLTKYLHISCLMRDAVSIPFKQLRTLRLRTNKKSTQIYTVNHERPEPRSSNFWLSVLSPVPNCVQV